MRFGPNPRRSVTACAAALAILGALALAGCDSTGKGLRPDGPTVSAAAAPSTEARPPFAGPQPAAAGALRSYAVGEAGNRPLKADWFSVPGLDSLNAQIEKTMVSEFDGYLGGQRFQPALFKPADLRPAGTYLKPTAPFPDPKYPGLQIQARVPVASGDFLLTQIDVATVGGAASKVRTKGFITDTAADTTQPAHVLLDLTAARARVHAALVQSGRLPEAAAAALKMPDGLFDHVDFGADGAAVVHLPAAVIDEARAAAGPGAAASGSMAPTAPASAATGTPSPTGTTPTAGTTGDASIAMGDEDLTALGRRVQDSLPAAWAYPAAAPAITNDFSCALLPCVAITYDDGPGPYTEKLLKELAAEKVHVSFFELGQQITRYPQITRNALAAGHVISSHTWNHPELPHLSPDAIHSQMDRTKAALKKAGVPDDGLMRPPYGAVNATVRREVGHAMILWDVDTLDWQNRNAAKTTQNVMAATRPGSIILMHDIHPTSVDAAPGIIDQLRSRGYYFVTVPDMFAGIPLKKGQTYRCRSTRPGCTDR